MKRLWLSVLLLVLGAAPCSALTVYVTYGGTVSAGFYDNLGLFGTPSANLAGQPYTATFVFDVSPNSNTYQVHSSTVNYIYGGSNYAPLYTSSPLLGATVTIGGVSVAMPGEAKGEISGEKNGGSSGFSKVIHIAQGFPGGVSHYLTQYIQNFAGAASGLRAEIDVAYAYFAQQGDTAFGDFSVCKTTCTAGTLIPSSFSVSLTSPVPLPATLPLLLAGIGAMGVLGLRRKRTSLSTMDTADHRAVERD